MKTIYSNNRHGIILFVIILIVLIIALIPYKSICSSISIFQPKHITVDVQKKPFIISSESPIVRLYLDTIRDTVCGLTLRTREFSVVPGVRIKKKTLDIESRILGVDWPWIGITMIGQNRLVNIEWALRLVIDTNIPGDFIECGVWRGGGSIFARAVFKALNIVDRNVWLVDSFQGLPKARTSNDDDSWSKLEYVKV